VVKGAFRFAFGAVVLASGLDPLIMGNPFDRTCSYCAPPGCSPEELGDARERRTAGGAIHLSAGQAMSCLVSTRNVIKASDDWALLVAWVRQVVDYRMLLINYF